MGLKFKLVNSADTYVYDDTYDIWKSKADDKDYMQQLVENGEDITIVGIVQPDYTASAPCSPPASLPRLPDREGHEGRCRQRHREAADGRPRHQRPHRRELRQG